MSQPLYKDASQPIETRIDDLLPRMTLAEKVGQLMQLDGGRGNLDDLIGRQQVGSLLHIQNQEAAKAMDMAADTRLGIPILFGDDCIHGHSFHPGATIFPTQLGMACSWNTDLIEESARITAREVRTTGLKWTFSPVLCITRDLRWGRVGETFGEDPFLIGEFGCAMIRGYQGKGLDDPEAILATAKHYAGYSETQGGRDASEADISRRKLRSFFFPPFERAAREGCLSFMTGYQSIDGTPSTASRWLLNDVLKDEWGFDGILVTDWDNVGRLKWEQKVVPTFAHAATLAIKSGNDLMMSTPEFYDGAQEAVTEGLVTEVEIDVILRRILKLKFRLGLFEDPGKPDLEAQARITGHPDHQASNLQLTRESLVLLKNDDLLPLAQNTPLKIAVIGPNADDAQAQLGDWAGSTGQTDWMDDGHPRECTQTVLDGIRALAPEGSTVTYAKGAHIALPTGRIEADYNDGQNQIEVWEAAATNPEQITEAVNAAEESDIAVVAVGDMMTFFGECKSTATLELQGGQLDLLRALAATGKPLIIVLINSKPLTLPAEITEAAAIIEAFSPGMTGGTAIAETIFGYNNPCGKLTVSFARHVGQQPIYYNQVRGQHGNTYADLTQDPLYAFGEGLSYSSYEYKDLTIETDKLSACDTFACEVTITNTSDRPGTEIAQLYISDLVTSVTWVEKELKAFQRVHLDDGESKRIRFEVPVSEFSIVNGNCERVVEPGEFEIQVGASSRNRDLLKQTVTVV